MPICQECLSRDLIKFGKYNNQQKWHCLNCGLTSIIVRKRMPRNGLRKVIRGYRKNLKIEKAIIATEISNDVNKEEKLNEDTCDISKH